MLPLLGTTTENPSVCSYSECCLYEDAAFIWAKKNFGQKKNGLVDYSSGVAGVAKREEGHRNRAKIGGGGAF